MIELQDPQDPQPLNPGVQGVLRRAAQASIEEQNALPAGLNENVANLLRGTAMRASQRLEPFTSAWAWEGAKRIARGIGDVAVNTVDAIPRGLSAVYEMGRWGIGQVTGSDETADDLAAGLRSVRGPIQLWTGKNAPDVLDVFQQFGVLDDPSAVRQSQSEKLDNGEMLFSMAGELAGFVLPGPSKFVGERVGRAAESVAGMASPMRRAAERMVASGKMTAEAATVATKEGRLLSAMAEAAGWGKPGKIAAYIGDSTLRLPPYSAMMAQMVAAAPADQQAEVAMHTALMGPVYLGIGRVFQDLGEAAARGLVNTKAAEAAIRLQNDFKNGVKNPAQFKRDMGMLWNDYGVPGVGNGLAAIGEAMGFTLVSSDWETLANAYSGDMEAQEKLLYTFLGTTGGMLAAKGLLPADQTPFYKRIRPDLNDLRVEVEGRIAQERAAEAKRQKGEQDAAAMQEREAREAERMQAATEYEPLARIVNPLMRSGLEVSKLDLRDVNAGVELRDPGDGSSVRVRLGMDGKTAKVTVTDRIWRMFRGREEAPRDTDGTITLTGEAADFFLSEMSTQAVVNRLQAAVEVEALGMRDTGRGYWRDAAGGRDVTIGLDGVYRQRPFGSEKWEPVDLQNEIIASLGQQQSGPAHWSPQLEQWSDFLQQKQTFMSEPGADRALAMALNYASRGTGDKAVEMRAFFESVKPEDVMSLFRPENSLVMAHSVAAIGAGYGNASWAIETIAKANQIATHVVSSPTGERLGVTFRDPAATTPEQQAQARQERQALFDLAKSRFRNKEAWERRLQPGEPPAEPPKLLTFSELADAPMPQGVRAVEPVRIAEPARDATREPGAVEPVLEAPGAAGEAKAQGREGEAGFVALPDGVGKRMAENPRRYFELMTDRVAGMGEVGRDIAERVKRGSGEVREKLGEIDVERARVGRDFSSTSRKKRNREVGRYLEDSIEVAPGVYESREMILSRGGELPEPVPEKLRAAVDDWNRTYDTLRRQTGEDATQSGTIKFRRGEPELARPAKDRIRVRNDLHEDLRFAEPNDPRAIEAVTKLAELNNRKPEDLIPSMLGEMSLDTGRARTPTERENAMDFARELPYMPQKVRLADGTFFHFLEGTPQSAYEGLVSQFQRNVAVRTLGQEGISPEVRKRIAEDPNTPPEVAARLGEDLPGARALLERLQKQPGITKADMEVATRLLQTYAGIPSEGYRGFVGFAANNPVTQGLVQLNLTAAGIYDIFANVFYTPENTGGFLRALARGKVPNNLKALFRLWGQDGWVAVNKMGAVLRETLNETFHRRTGKIGALLRVVGAPSRYLQKFNELWAATTANIAVRDMRAGKDQKYYAEVLRSMGFQHAEVQAMVTGSASQQLYNRYVQQNTALLTGSTLPHEGSYAGSSKKFTSLVRFQRWHMARAAILHRKVAAIVTAKDTPEAWRASRNLLGMLVGTTLGGIASTYLVRIAKEGVDDATESMMRKGGGELATEGFAMSQLGGAPVQWVTDAWKVFWGTEDLMRAASRATYPSRVGYELSQAIGEMGPYRNMPKTERLMTWAGRTVAIGRYMDGVFAAAGLMNDWGVDEAQADAFRYLEQVKGPQYGAMFSDFKRPEFRRAMRSLYKQTQAAAGEGNLEEIVRSTLGKALDLGTGKEIAQSLRASKMLSRLSPEELAGMRQAIGETKMARLYMADQALEKLARMVQGEAGTPEAVEKMEFQTRLEEAEMQTRLGNQGEVWNDLWSDVRERAVASVVGGEMNLEEIRMLSDKLALYPEVYGKVLGDSRQARAVADASTGERWQMVYGLLVRRVVEAAKAQQREALRAAR